MAHAHLAPLGAPQVRAIRIAADSGNRTVFAGQATRASLRTLARRGLGALNYQPGLGRRNVVEALTLNQRGAAEAADKVAA
jgi:hypothetical protein